MILVIKLKVKDKLEAYKIVSHLGFEHEVLEADFNKKIYKFNKKIKNKQPKHFLKENFGKKL